MSLGGSEFCFVFFLLKLKKGRIKNFDIKIYLKNGHRHKHSSKFRSYTLLVVLFFISLFVLYCFVCRYFLLLFFLSLGWLYLSICLRMFLLYEIVFNTIVCYLFIIYVDDVDNIIFDGSNCNK